MLALNMEGTKPTPNRHPAHLLYRQYPCNHHWRGSVRWPTKDGGVATPQLGPNGPSFSVLPSLGL